jgi:hypothetical protein
MFSQFEETTSDISFYLIPYLWILSSLMMLQNQKVRGRKARPGVGDAVEEAEGIEGGVGEDEAEAEVDVGGDGSDCQVFSVVLFFCSRK